MKTSLSTVLILCFLGVTNVSAQKQTNAKGIDATLACKPPQYSNDQFVYHGISNRITKEMLAFTKKYDIGFHNPGCIVMNREHSKAHNIKIAESLTSAIGSKDWISELPLKIDGVN